MSNPKHLFSLVDECINLNDTFDQMKLIWSIKQFPQNVSITILTGKNDNMFLSSSLLEKKYKQTTLKNVEFKFTSKSR